MGLLAGMMAAAEAVGKVLPPPPPETAMGALIRHITGGADASTFQPMNVNFGLFPPLAQPVKAKAERNPALAARALSALQGWLTTDA